MTLTRLAVALAFTLPIGAQSERAAGYGPAPTIETYEVGDLLRTARPAPAAEPDELLARERRQLTHLEQFIRTFIQPSLSDDEDVAALGRGTLVALCQPEQHAWIHRLLNHQRRTGPSHVVVQIRILDVTEEGFEEHFAPILGGADGAPHRQATRQPGVETDQWLARVLASALIETVEAPQLLANPLARTEMTVGNEITYVKDYEVEHVQGRVLANPIVDTLFSGVSIETICGVLADNNIGVTFALKRTEVDEPIPQFVTSLAGDDTKLTLDLPTWRVIHLEQKLIVPDGGIAIVSKKNNDRHFVAIVNVRIQRL